MQSKHKTAVSLILVGLVVAALAFWRRAPEPSPSSSPAASSPRTLHFPVGQVLEYAFELRHDATALLLEQSPVGSKTALSGVLGLEGLADGMVRVRFSSLTRAEFSIEGREALEEASLIALRAEPAYLSIDERGRIDRILFEENAPETFTRLMQLLAVELRFELDDGVAWSRKEPTLHGDLATDYEASTSGVEHLITRRAALVSSRFERAELPAPIVGQRTARWHQDGRLSAIDAEESLLVRDRDGTTLQTSNTVLHARFLRQIPAPAASPVRREQLSVRTPHEIPLSDRAEANALEQRIDGLTKEVLVENLSLAMVGGQAPDHNRFLWRASGLIEREAAVIAAMEPLFQDTKTTHEGRALILDLLVGAGTEEAQSALIRLVSSARVDADPSRIHLRQRLALLSHPSKETVEFLEEKARAADAWREPARVALGAAAQALRVQGDEKTAARLTDALAKMLSEAADPREVEVLLVSLGNAKDERHESAIRAHAHHVEGSVRFAVADALRSMPSSSAGVTLLELAQDADPEVSRKALDSLRERQPLDAAAFTTLTSALEAKRIPPTALPELATLCAEGAKQDGPSRSLLLRMLETGGADVNLRARIRRMLDR